MKKITQVLFIAFIAIAFAACNGGEKKEECKEDCKKEGCAEKHGEKCADDCEKECCSDKKGGEEAHVCGDDCKDGCTHKTEEAHVCSEECGDECAHKTEDAGTEEGDEDEAPESTEDGAEHS